MNLIKKIKNIFTKKKSIDYNKDYWFPTYQNPIVRKIKINKIYKKDRSITFTHYDFVSHPINKKFIIPVGNISDNNTAYGYSSFPNPINKIRIKKLNKIYGRDHEV